MLDVNFKGGKHVFIFYKINIFWDSLGSQDYMQNECVPFSHYVS